MFGLHFGPKLGLYIGRVESHNTAQPPAETPVSVSKGPAFGRLPATARPTH